MVSVNDYIEEEYEVSYLNPNNFLDSLFIEEYQKQINFPEDFVERFATKIMIYCERLPLLADAMKKVAKMVQSNLSNAQSFKILLDVFKHFEESEATEKFLNITFNAIVINGVTTEEEQKSYGKFLSWLVYCHKKSLYENHKPRQELLHSYITQSLGNAFLTIIRNDSEDFLYFSRLFSHLIKIELHNLDLAKEKAKVESDLIVNVHRFNINSPSQRYLFEDILDYIYNLSQSKSDEFNSGKTDKDVQVLLERLENVRSFTIQSVINIKAIKYNEMLKEELRSQTCTPEDLINAEEIFYKSIILYRMERRYNFKYIVVEDIRVLSQLFSVVLGFLIMIASLAGQINMDLFEGVAVFLLMIIHGGFAYSRRLKKTFYPEDNSPKLEFEISNFADYFKKMSPQQLEAFLSNIVQDRKYNTYYTYVADFINYIYGLIKNKDLIICSQDDLLTVVQKIEIMANRKHAGMSN